MDQDYEPNMPYAQYGVRMAFNGNTVQDIHAFAISTVTGSPGGLKTMLPRRRFTIVPGIRQLPRILPQLCLRLTFRKDTL